MPLPPHITMKDRYRLTRIVRNPVKRAVEELLKVSRLSQRVMPQQCRRRREDADTNYRGPAVRKGALGPVVLYNWTERIPCCL